MRITTPMMTCMFFLAVSAASGQPQNEHEAPRLTRTLNHGNWVGKRVLTKEFLQKVGIEGEQAAKLKAELEDLDVKALKLDEVIKQAAFEQAEIAKKVLSEPGASVDEIMKIIERIGQYRTDQAKLATQRLVVIRDNLTAEQRQKASEILSEESKKRMEERAARFARDERERNGRPAATRPATPKGW